MFINMQLGEMEERSEDPTSKHNYLAFNQLLCKL